MKTLILITILFFSSFAYGICQTINCTLSENNLDYKLIKYLDTGEMEYYKDFDNDYEAGYNYRIIVRRFEIIESLFIEKIIVDVEGIPNKIDWCKKINLNPVLEKWKINLEQISIDIIEWKSHDSFDIKVNEKIFNVKIIDSKNIEIELKTHANKN